MKHIHFNKNIIILFLIFTIGECVQSQDTLKIDSSGYKLQAFYLSLNVTGLWISGHHINWETGEPDKSNATEGIKTHCSAFVAAACKKLSIYILRPPDHGQVLLSNAQYDWLFTDDAVNKGWTEIKTDKYYTSQIYANEGYVVVAAFKSSDDSKPGHIALIMPTEIDKNTLNESGPILIQAGTENSESISLKEGFKHHIKKWPENKIEFFYNEKEVE